MHQSMVVLATLLLGITPFSLKEQGNYPVHWTSAVQIHELKAIPQELQTVVLPNEDSLLINNNGRFAGAITCYDFFSLQKEGYRPILTDDAKTIAFAKH